MAPIILLIETSTKLCSVALAKGNEIVAMRESLEENSHSSLVTVFIEEIVKETGIALNLIDAVTVGMGPGSYTGLRIGVSVAKGLCYSLDKPLIAVNSLQTMAYQVLNNLTLKLPIPLSKECLLMPMIDARRMEVYTACYDFNGHEIEKTSAKIIDEQSFSHYHSQSILYFGTGASKCVESFSTKSNMYFIDSVYPSTKFMIYLALKKINESLFENIAYFEPFYLKDFITTTKKNSTV